MDAPQVHRPLFFIIVSLRLIRPKLALIGCQSGCIGAQGGVFYGVVCFIICRIFWRRILLARCNTKLNAFAPGDPRDTTTPAAMTETWHALLLGDVLKPASRTQLIEWMSHGGVTGALMRASLPKDWAISDKSGAGSHTRNLVAMVTPPGRAPFLVSIFISDTDVDFETRNGALKDISAAIVNVLKSR